MVPREVNLQEKRMYVLFPMVLEPYFSIPAEVASPVQPTVVATPAVDVGPSSTTTNEQEITPFPEPSFPVVILESLAAAEAMGPGQENMSDDPPSEQPQIEE